MQKKTVIILLLASVYLAYAMESINSRGFLINISPYYFLFSTFIILNIMILFLAISGRMYFSFFITFIIFLILSCVSYFKYAARGEPLYFGDLAFAFQITGVADTSNIVITKYIVNAAATGIIVSIGLFLSKVSRLSLRVRGVCLITSALALAFIYKADILFIDGETGYSHKGFIVGFLDSMSPSPDVYNAFAFEDYEYFEEFDEYEASEESGELGEANVSANTVETEDPDEKARNYITRELDKLKSEIPENRTYSDNKPNVIIILSESFWDITKMEMLSFSEEPIPHYKELSEDCVSGNMISYTFGGGTANVEFELITGSLLRFLYAPDSAYQSVVKDETQSLASVFKEFGYTTMGVHTYDRTFYSRDRVYPLLGFDKWIGVQDIENSVYDGKYVSDMTLTDEIIKNLEDGDDPKFIFAISMENHQPYTKDKYSENDIKVLNEDMDEDLRDGVEAYVHGLHNADAQLGRLVEYLEECDTPTSLLFFGDHQPTLGADFGLYRYAGIISDPNNRVPKDYKKTLATPFLIWSNYKDESNYIEAIGDNFLGSYLLSYLDMPKPLFYYFLDNVYENYFHFMSRKEMYLDKDDEPWGVMSHEQQRICNLYMMLQSHMLTEPGTIRDELQELY